MSAGPSLRNARDTPSPGLPGLMSGAVRAGMSVGTAARANQGRTTPARRLWSGFRLSAVVAAAVICGHAEAPRRIISTAPSITEMLYTLGL